MYANADVCVCKYKRVKQQNSTTKSANYSNDEFRATQAATTQSEAARSGIPCATNIVIAARHLRMLMCEEQHARTIVEMAERRPCDASDGVAAPCRKQCSKSD